MSIYYLLNVLRLRRYPQPFNALAPLEHSSEQLRQSV